MSNFDATAFRHHFAAAVAKGRIESQTPESSWFPCGFASLTCKTRKNSKLGKELVALGFRWSDYEKTFRTALYDTIPPIAGMSQSMDYRERVLNAVASHLNANGYEFSVWTRID